MATGYRRTLHHPICNRENRLPASIAELSNVDLRLGGTPILRGVDLCLHPGEVIGLVGPNGSGKSTLLRVVATLLPPSAGGGSVLGASLGSDAVYSVRPRIGLVGHTAALYPELTLTENLALAARLRGLDPDRVAAVLAIVGLAGAADRRASHSSLGMQRRVDLARLLLTQPDLVLLDEPYAGLDQAAAGLIAALLAEARARGGGALVVSHEADRLMPVVDRVVVLREGVLE